MVDPEIILAKAGACNKHLRRIEEKVDSGIDRFLQVFSASAPATPPLVCDNDSKIGPAVGHAMWCRNVHWEKIPIEIVNYSTYSDKFYDLKIVYPLDSYYNNIFR